MKFTIQMTVVAPDHLDVRNEVQTLKVREGGCMENDMLMEYAMMVVLT